MLYQDLKGAIKAEALTIAKLARRHGFSLSYLNNVLNGRGSIRIDHAYEIMEDLHLPLEQIYKYFPPKGERQIQVSSGNQIRGNQKSREVIHVGRR